MHDLKLYKNNEYCDANKMLTQKRDAMSQE